MEIRNDVVFPIFRAVHPGEILHEELKERGIKQKEFANECGIQPSHLNEVLKGKRSISKDLAFRLEEKLSIPAKEWLALQSSYDCDVITLNKRSMKEKKASASIDMYNKIFDIGIKEGIINTAKKMLAKGMDVKTIMELTSLSEKDVNKLMMET